MKTSTSFLPTIPFSRRPSCTSSGLALASLALLSIFTLAGCSTPAQISGDYQTPQGNFNGAVFFSTNSINISGAYATTNQVLSGSINLK